MCSVMSKALQPHGLQPTRLLCPWNFSWSGLLCPPPGDLPDSGIAPVFLIFPALAGGFFATSATWEAHNHNDSVLSHLLYDIRKVSPHKAEALLSSFEIIIIKLYHLYYLCFLTSNHTSSTPQKRKGKKKRKKIPSQE